MANFGFAQLTVVAPYEERWREAKSAVQAGNLLQNAKSAERLTEAIADCTLVIGTGSLTHRKPEQQIIPLPALAPVVREELNRGGRVALVFGSEKRGLTREDLSHCHVLVEIPTAPSQPSMNLGQAVAVCLYELSSRLDESSTPCEELFPQSDSAVAGTAPTPAPPQDASLAASASELELLTGLVEDTMRAANYSPAAMQKANRHDVQLLLRRLTLTRHDARRMLGLFRRILWRLRQ
jgi:tRNA/rRNA methyltransferase